MKFQFERIYLLARAVVLRCLGLFLRGSAPAGEPAAPGRILFIRIDRLGDMVLSIPALTALKEKYPAARLSVLAAPYAAGLLEGDPRVDGVYLWEPGLKRFFSRIKVMRELRSAGFDLVIDPHSGYELKTALIAFLTGAPLRAGYDTAGRGVFFDLRSAPPPAGTHFSEEAFGVLKLLGIDGPGSGPAVRITRAAESEADGLLKEAGVKPADLLISVHPGGHYPSQRGQAGRFAAVINALAAERGARTILIGVSSELGVLDGVLSGLDRAAARKVVKAVDLKAGTLCALIRRSGLFIGNNSGPLHIAAAFKVPSVSTMGPTDESRWKPLGAGQIVLRADLPCLSCGKGRCEERSCMENITAELMLEKARLLLPGSGGGTA